VVDVSLSPEQIEQRKRLITASDAAAILGLNPWRSPLDVWASKVHEDAKPIRQNFKMRRGHAVEPLLLEWLGEQRAPLRVVPAGDKTLTHPLLTWLGATPDGLVYDGDALKANAEAKSSGAVEHWQDEAGDPQIPDYYHPQVVVQMAVTNAPSTLVVAEILTDRGPESEPWIIEVERDRELEAIVLEELDDFRRKYIETRTPPDLESATYRQIATVFRRPQRAELLPASTEASDLARRYLAAQEAKKAAEVEIEATKAEICKAIGDAEGLHGDEWKATWRWREGGPVSFVRDGYRHFDLRAVGVAAKKGRKAA
jgi:putative phage-type endonuclease